VPTLTRPATPACLPPLRPQRACRRPPPPLSARPTPPAAGYLNDLYRFSAADNAWTALSPSSSGPSPRFGMGFAATPDGMLYVFGGSAWNNGIEGGGGNRRSAAADGAGCVGGRGWGGRRYVVDICIDVKRRSGPYMYRCVKSWQSARML
jgi:hypothetical protein